MKKSRTVRLAIAILSTTALAAYTFVVNPPKAEGLVWGPQSIYNEAETISGGNEPAYSLDEFAGRNMFSALLNGSFRQFSGGLSLDDLKNNATDENINDLLTSLEMHGGYIPLATNLTYTIAHNPGYVGLAQYKNHMLAKASAPMFAAQAQSGGSDILNPILEIWQQMRNISYMLLAAISVVAGFMIMMRKKLDPRTSVTVMYMLPRMVMTLILITFSYPIIAFLIDISFVLVGIAYNAIIANTNINIGQMLGALTVSLATGLSPFRLLQIAFGHETMGEAIQNLSISSFQALIMLVMLVVFIVALFTSVITIITRYARLMLMTALGPILLVWDFLPGENKQMTNWFKGALANALAIPGIAVMLFLSIHLLGASTPETASWFGGIEFPDMFTALVTPILAVVVLLQSISIPKAIDKAILGKDRAPGWYAPGFKQR